MSGNNFDRVRPRNPGVSEPTPMNVGVDSEGKRALFTKAADVAQPGVGSALVECSRCNGRTVLRPIQALRASLPSLHLGFRIGHGDDVRTVGVRGDYETFMKCPSCGRPSWVRFTLQV
jgi:hypothetical protein